MNEREYSHRLGNKKTSFLHDNARLAGTEKPTKADTQTGELNSGDAAECFYHDLLVTDTGLAEMWMELRV